MNKYRIFNRRTQEWWEGEAMSVTDACEKAGWMLWDCWVRLYTARGGWKNITRQKEAYNE